MILYSDNIPQVRRHCDTIRKLLSEGTAKLVHIIVDKAEKHYHKKTTEYYYVLDRTGHISLDDKIQRKCLLLKQKLLNFNSIFEKV
ncbi:hypothetical protein [Okeania sp. SIO2B3]|uniref:hypothetical protein n=1 Tax=Okeania sp. SIO2B3 TaxID=2607784 RepID=UPI0013BF4106|nr:hypothetical protein [Okeania sp. SIO2B3]NET42020.1 hypothetical protein [Okeania sp. SIO2B3]